MVKNLFTLIIIVTLICCSFIPLELLSYNQVYADADISLLVNGTRLASNPLVIIRNERVLVPVRAFFEFIGADVRWEENTRAVSINSKGISIAMHIGIKDYTVNGSLLKMDVAPLLYNDSTMVPVRFVSEGLKYSVSWDGERRIVSINTKANQVSLKNSSRQYKVVIDPGHGGSQTGAVYGGITEKELNLDIAKRLEKLLINKNIKTYMTRTGDYNVGLYERSGLANYVDADLFVSIHNNADKLSTKGTMTLYYPGKAINGFSSQYFASIVQKQIVNDLNTRNLGTIPRPWLAVLRTTAMPAILVEFGYMTNKEELKKLKTPEYRQRAAESLSRAIIYSLNEL